MDDRIDLLLAGAVLDTCYIEDVGIGAYEYWGFKGVDRRRQVIGTVSLPLPDGMTREEAEALLVAHRQEIVEKLHAAAVGRLPRWDAVPWVGMDDGRLTISAEYSAEPPTKAAREYEEA